MMGGAAACAGPEGPAGAKGDPGAPGAAGTNGKDGTSGQDGQDGKDGANGKDAVLDSSLSPIEKAFVFAGGKDALAAIDGIHVESKGTRWAIGEGYTPDSAPVLGGTFTLSTDFDIKGDNLRQDYTRHIVFLGFNLDTKFSEIIQGQLGYVSGAESIFGLPEQGDMTSDRWGAARRQNQLLNPHLLLRAAAKDPSIVHDAGAEVIDGILYRRVELDDKVANITLYVSDATGRIEKLRTLDNNYVARDTEVEVYFTDWKVNDQKISYPGEVLFAYDGQIIHQDTRSAFETNPALDPKKFDFPAGASPKFDAEEAKRGAASHQFHEVYESVGIALDGPQNLANPIPIAPGVWQLQGGIHNVGIIEQSNGLVMLDAPIHELRSKAVLAWAAQQYPNKPIKHVIVTHFHDDHSGGVREIAATGADVIVGAASGDYFRRALKAPSTVYPDTLSKSPKAVPVIEVPADGSYTIADPLRPVTAYPVENIHAADMLMIYTPDSKALWVTDLINVSNPPQPALFLPAALQLYDSITKTHKLDVALLFTGHGAGSNTFDQFKQVIGVN
jgi:glyoxylase-like metal-dependent hydrolase (beta-lactamase superfamily II)